MKRALDHSGAKLRLGRKRMRYPSFIELEYI